MPFFIPFLFKPAKLERSPCTVRSDALTPLEGVSLVCSLWVVVLTKDLWVTEGKLASPPKQTDCGLLQPAYAVTESEAFDRV